MTHTVTVTTTMIWHDLTDDPNDLPESNVGSWRVLCRDIETGRLYCLSAEADIWFEPEQKIWMTKDDEGGTTYGIRSHGIDPVSIDEEETDEWASDEMMKPDEFVPVEIVAWAEETRKLRIPYVPAVYRKETDE